MVTGEIGKTSEQFFGDIALVEPSVSTQLICHTHCGPHWQWVKIVKNCCLDRMNMVNFSFGGDNAIVIIIIIIILMKSNGLYIFYMPFDILRETLYLMLFVLLYFLDKFLKFLAFTVFMFLL